MSKLVEINVENLVWCNVGFGFYPDQRHVNCLQRQFLERPYSCGNGYLSYIGIDGHPDNTSKVMVDPDKYEAAVISRIKEMFNTQYSEVLKIAKNITCDKDPQERGVIAMVKNSDGERSIWISVALNADPRPWEHSYTIELFEDDDE